MKHVQPEQTVSRIHQNVADWHYGAGLHFWRLYYKLLDDRGRYQSKDAGKVKFFLSRFRFHMQLADHLLHRGPSIRRRVRPYRVDPANQAKFAQDFESAVNQRTAQAVKKWKRSLLN